MLGAKKMIWKLFSLTLGGLIMGLMLCMFSGCNDQDDAASMAQQLALRNGGTTRPVASQQQPEQTPTVPGLNPCGETDPDADQTYTGPKVIVTDFFVKLPYEGYEGSRKFDIICVIQAEEAVDSKAIWEIVALDITGKIVGTQNQHLVIPDDYSKPLDINSFYCTAVPASLEFRITSKLATPLGDDEAGGKSGGGSGAQRGIT